MNCPKCNGELRIVPEQVANDEQGLPIYHRIAYCDTCMTRTDLDEKEKNLSDGDGPLDQQSADDMQASQSTPDGSPNTDVKKKNTRLSIIALILSIIGITRPVGMLLAIFDLSKRKKDGNKHTLSVAALVIGCLLYAYGIAAMFSETPQDNSGADISVAGSADEGEAESEEGQDEEAANGEEVQDEEVAEEPLVMTTESFKDMKVGDIGKKGDVYVGLSYVKKMSVLPTALGENDEVGEGKEVILGFFDFFNSSEERQKVNPEDITCYADGVQVESVQGNYIAVVCDGIRQYYYPDMEGYTQMISVQDFAVSSGWSELKFFYKSDCVWTVTPDDVKTEEFEFSSMYDIDVQREPTEEGTVIYQGDYEVVFKGVTDYTYHNVVWGDQPYVIFKFTVNNTGDAAIDYETAGHEMTAYQNNYYLGDASYALDDQVDGYSNIFNIDTIEPGMTANIYVAFDAFVTDGDLFMVYDDGYISNKIRGSVFVER